MSDLVNPLEQTEFGNIPTDAYDGIGANSLEYQIKLGREFSIGLLLSSSGQYISLLRKRISTIQASIGKSQHETYRFIFLQGLRATEEMLKDKGLPVDDVSIAISGKLAELKTEKEERRRLEEIYHAVGLNEFTAWCSKNNINHERFLAEYKLFNADSLTTNVRNWLYNFLSDGEEYHASTTIKQAILEDGLIKASDEDWQLVKNVATREGFPRGSSRHGFWRWNR